MIPFVDLTKEYREIGPAVRRAIERVLKRQWFVLGPEVKAFERAFARFLGAPHCVSVNSGSDALWLVLKALGIGKGDEVITVAHTFVSTVDAIVRVEAAPVFVDVRPDTATMNPALVREKITTRTKAILPVHLYGQPADLEPLLHLARRYRLKLIEDACQAHGALWHGKPVGTLGDLGAFSFYPSKNLGAYGDGGAVVTKHRRIAEKLKRLRNYGQAEKYRYVELGANSRLDELQAAVLAVKLRFLKRWNESRRRNARLYHKLLNGIEGLELPVELPDRTHAYHLYVIQTDQRDALRAHLARRGIETGLHYPVPVHLQPSYRRLGYRRGDLPVTERWAQRALSLPLHPFLTLREITTVCRAVHSFFQ